MTCVVGLVDNGRVWVGGDSVGVAGYDAVPRSDPKVFRNGPLLIGFTTSFRMGQLLRFALKVPPHHPPEKGDFEWLCTDLIDAVRATLKAGGFAEKQHEVEWGGSFLLGYRGGLYEVGRDYQVGIPADGFAAVGCGDQVALGAMFATQGQAPEDRVRTALLATQRFSTGVREPFLVEVAE